MIGIALLIVIPATALLVLAYLRKEKLDRDYMELVSKVAEGGSPVAKERLRVLEEYMRSRGLRRGIMSLILGATFSIISLMTGYITDEGFADFMVVAGIIVCAYGIGCLLIWLLFDRKRIAPAGDLD